MHYSWIIAAVTFVILSSRGDSRDAGVLMVPPRDRVRMETGTAISFAVAVNIARSG